MIIYLYNWKKNFWVEYDPNRKKGDGAKPQNFFLPQLIPIYTYLKELNNIQTRTPVTFTIDEKRFFKNEI